MTMTETENHKSELNIDGILGEDEGSIDLSGLGDSQESNGLETDLDMETILEKPATQAPSEPDELEKYKDLVARSQADLENYRKRMARERLEAIQYANLSLLSSLLPVIDNFEMGLKAAKNEGENSIIYQGMTMVQRQMHDFLSENKVELISVEEGAPFDPNFHEAIKQEASDFVAEGKVIYSLRNGYRLKERLLRPANVVISSGPAKKVEEVKN
jgi:molecular chaperone GrpE